MLESKIKRGKFIGNYLRSDFETHFSYETVVSSVQVGNQNWDKILTSESTLARRYGESKKNMVYKDFNNYRSPIYKPLKECSDAHIINDSPYIKEFTFDGDKYYIGLINNKIALYSIENNEFKLHDLRVYDTADKKDLDRLTYETIRSLRDKVKQAHYPNWVDHSSENSNEKAA